MMQNWSRRWKLQRLPLESQVQKSNEPALSISASTLLGMQQRILHFDLLYFFQTYTIAFQGQ